MQDLKESIAAVEKMVQKATGKKKFLLKKQLIEMHQEQYTIKGMFKQQMITHNIIKSITKTDLSENITINEDGEPVSDGLITFFNHEHISALLCNYSALKEDAWGKFSSDSYYMMEDLDNLSNERHDGNSTTKTMSLDDLIAQDIKEYKANNFYN